MVKYRLQLVSRHFFKLKKSVLRFPFIRELPMYGAYGQKSIACRTGTLPVRTGSVYRPYHSRWEHIVTAWSDYVFEISATE